MWHCQLTTAPPPAPLLAPLVVVVVTPDVLGVSAPGPDAPRSHIVPAGPAPLKPVKAPIMPPWMSIVLAKIVPELDVKSVMKTDRS